MQRYLCVLSLLMLAPAQADQRQECERLVSLQLPTDDAMPGWHFPALDSGHVYMLAISGRPLPVTVAGDLDGDKKRDIAYLIETSSSKEQMIAVCLSSKPKDVQYIRKLGCIKGIELRAKTQWGYKTDVMAAYCLDDKTSLTYEYKNGKFTAAYEEPGD